MIAAFVDGEQRGVARALEGPGFSSYDYVFLMMCYSNENSGETLTFQYYSASDDAVYDVATTLEWYTDMVIGDAINPFIYELSSGVTNIELALGSGWNWISINVEGDDMTLNSVLETLEYGTYIKGQEGYSDFYPGFGWFGGLEDISVEQMYKIYLSEVMLQQTQVKTVLPYYKKWVNKYPTVQSVANANQEQILKQWEGLGYYGRARNFHKSCQTYEFNFSLLYFK